jgi:hypothetical protein
MHGSELASELDTHEWRSVCVHECVDDLMHVS